MSNPNEVKRWVNDSLGMEVHPNGNWVKYSDYQVLEAQKLNDAINDTAKNVDCLLKAERTKREEVEGHLFTCQGMLLSDQTKLATANAKIVELEKKCKNLDRIIGSLDVKDPNACDALLNVQLINQKTIHELKLENKALRDMYDGTQIVLSEVQAELSTANKKAENLEKEIERLKEYEWKYKDLSK